MSFGALGQNFLPTSIQFPQLTTISEMNVESAKVINKALGLTDTNNVPASMVTALNQWASSRFDLASLGQTAVDVLNQALPVVAQYYLNERLIDQQAKLGALQANPTEDQIKAWMKQLDAAYVKALQTCGRQPLNAQPAMAEIPPHDQIGGLAGQIAGGAMRGALGALAPYNNQQLDEFFTERCGDGRARPTRRVQVQGPAGKLWMFGYLQSSGRSSADILGEPILFSGDLAAVRRVERIGKRAARALGKTFQNRERRRTRRRR